MTVQRPPCKICQAPATHAYRQDFRCSEHAEIGLHRDLYSVYAPDLGALDLSPHGLRAMALCDAKLTGISDQDIAALYNISPAMVARYTRHIDRERAGRAARERMERGGSVKRLAEFVKRQ